MLEVNMVSQQPIYEQLINQIIYGIASKMLSPGEALPSARRLSADLGINYHTVNKAYQSLSDDGYIEMDRRRTAAVSGEIPKGDSFVEELSAQLSLAAAQAKCHGMSEREFSDLAATAFRKFEEGNGGAK
ncbi:MAG: GntR family transcriptional regulator [Clostridiales bacterium]|nr:GntR family transcriptional regulator [Clostridiales bacterium]